MSNHLEDGYTRIANGLLDEVATRKFNGSQFRIILVIWRYTYGFHRKSHYFSLTFLAEQTGLNKDLIKREIKKLIESEVLFIANDPTFNKSRELGFNKYFDQWKIPKSTEGAKQHTGDEIALSRGGELVTSTGGNLAPQLKKEKENNKNSQLEDGMPITDDSVHEISSNDPMQAVEDHYIKRRGRGLQVNAKDISSIKEILAENIPLEAILTGIDQAFDTYQPRYPGDCIRTFSYCATVIRESYYTELERNKPVEIKEYQPRANRPRKMQEVRKDKLPSWIEKQAEEAKQQQQAAQSQEQKETEEAWRERLQAKIKALKPASNL